MPLMTATRTVTIPVDPDNKKQFERIISGLANVMADHPSVDAMDALVVLGLDDAAYEQLKEELAGIVEFN